MTSGQLTVIDRTSKRFADDFDVAPAAGHTPTPAEETYLATLQRVTYALAGDEETEASDNDPASAVVLARRKLRASAVAELRSEAEEVAKGTLSTDIAADNALVIKGKYVAARDRLSTSLFVVEERFEGPLATDLLIRVARDLPPPNDVPSPEKQALFVALSAANTVVKTVCLRMKDRADNWFRRHFTASGGANERLRADRLLDQYVRKLAGIGRLGLEGPFGIPP